MARLLEDDAKELLASAGVTVPKCKRISQPSEAKDFYQQFRKPVVIKALVPVGGRQKVGAVKMAYSAEEAEAVSKALLGSSVYGFLVDKLLIEHRVHISRELYVSFANDVRSRSQLVLVGAIGGVDVEEIRRMSPDSIVRYLIDPILGLELFQARHLCQQLDFKAELLVQLSTILYELFKLYRRLDAVLLEVNPLAITHEQKFVATSCVLEIDDDALFRQHELSDKVILGLDRAWRPLTEREKEVMQVDIEDPYRGTIRYTEFEGGDIGFLCGGGGASLMLQDSIRGVGGKPANYSEWGGNPPEQKLETLTKVVVSKPGVKGLLICLNISNNTRTDIAAKGIVKMLKELEVDPKKMPVVVRLAGLNDELAKSMFEEGGYEYHGEDMTMEEATHLIVKLVSKT